MMAEAKEVKTEYFDAKRMAKHADWLAKSEAEKEEFATISPDGDGVFHIIEQMDHTNRDVVGENCVHNDTGQLVLTAKDKMKAWVEHYAELSGQTMSSLQHLPPQWSAQWRVWSLERELMCIRALSLAYTNNLVLTADTLEAYISKLKAWKAGLESKGLWVNMKKDKFLVSGVGHDVLKKSGKYPCVVCCRVVGSNSILCSQCRLWVHKKYSSFTKQLMDDPHYVCPRCNGNA